MWVGVIKTLNDVSHIDTKVFSLGGLNSLIRLQVVSVLSFAAGVQWMLGDAKQHSQRYVNSGDADDPCHGFHNRISQSLALSHFRHNAKH